MERRSICGGMVNISRHSETADHARQLVCEALGFLFRRDDIHLDLAVVSDKKLWSRIIEESTDSGDRAGEQREE